MTAVATRASKREGPLRGEWKLKCEDKDGDIRDMWMSETERETRSTFSDDTLPLEDSPHSRPQYKVHDHIKIQVASDEEDEYMELEER